MTLRKKIVMAALALIVTLLIGVVMALHYGSCSDDGRVVGKGSCYYQGGD